MKPKLCLRLLLAFFIASTSLLSAVLIETANFSEVLKYVKPESLVILDVDDTLLIPTQTLGTDVWFIHRTKQYQAASMSSQQALEKALADWEAIRHLTDVKIVEKGSEEIVRGLQERHIVVMGLTTQGLALSTRTISQLHSLNIDLSRTAPSAGEYYFMNGHGVLYRQGLLSTSGTPKGPALLKFLDIIGYCPRHIIFINDKATHLKDVEAAVMERGIEFIGLRYAYSDRRVAEFDPKIAEIQWHCSSFAHILTDQEAAELAIKAAPIP